MKTTIVICAVNALCVLTVLAGATPTFFDGDLRLKETKKGIVFSFIVVRGPSAHTGEIEGVATARGDSAIYTEIVPPEDGRKPCEIVFTFIDGHIVQVKGKDTGYYGGMGVSFDGTYYKSR